ncbi:carboxyl transferase domain-containing protein [Carboxylicivirga sp. M1479]|uniref:carboxyl transferase domain-containing protein n=1 Tax=Carboxylicivirga sp. M1479 TaxID=2594476 RepID=UPI001177C839|nr:carboxyl transferase domain-containing protein [Carboxylicivirga sp. M1479]TRX71304.1 methylcrotonoyl-CoA carboxylase [Carboxylicivirga sp. M1479]
MFKYNSSINTNSEAFIKNQQLNQSLADEYFQKLQHIQQGGGNKALQKHMAKGKLPVRQRIDYLLDKDSYFLELSALAANGLYDDAFPAAGIITGIGMVHGRRVMVIANDATVKGGTYISETIKKHLRAQEIAQQNNLPCIYMVDSGGVFLPQQAEVFPDRDDFGRIFFNQSRMSAQGIAQIAIVMGSCTAGGAYVPAMSDETIIVKEQGTIFLAGPPLVKAATGEEVSAEELGGGAVHTQISGVADHLADNDEHALHICRNIIETLPQQNDVQENNFQAPKYATKELLGLIPESGKPFPNVHEIIARLVDDSAFHEFKSEYGTTLVTAFAQIEGKKVGILANNGILFSESALKGTHFIQLCNERNIPMLFLQNITGFMVGKNYEHKGIAKDGAKMVNALANSKVPYFTILMGGSYGAGNYAMAGRAYDPRFLFMWPNARISVMGAKQAAQVLTTIKRDQATALNKEVNEQDLAQIEASIIKKYEAEGSPYYSTSRLWDDGIIIPESSRQIAGLVLNIISKEQKDDTKYGIFRM